MKIYYDINCNNIFNGALCAKHKNVKSSLTISFYKIFSHTIKHLTQFLNYEEDWGICKVYNHDFKVAHLKTDKKVMALIPTVGTNPFFLTMAPERQNNGNP